jgi:hypothetical protein
MALCIGASLEVVGLAPRLHDVHLIGQDVPNAVAREDDELPVGLDGADLDVRTARDDLVFGAFVRIRLEREVAEGTR